MEGFERIHKQWMSLLVVQHPIWFAEGVPQSLQFAVCNLRVDLSDKLHGLTHVAERYYRKLLPSALCII